jgi:3-oxoacyl-[acyl-carrier protein] reductase
MDIKRKNAVVTGGDRGIGQAISIALAEKGANVAVHFHRNEDKARETSDKIKGLGVKTMNIQADVIHFSEVVEMAERAKKTLGSIDILVNNSGISGPNTDLTHISVDEWKEVIDVNLTGIFNCCKACVTELRKNRGKIVNISSIAGKMGGTIGCHYAASKAGVIGLTFALASELAPDVTVNAVAPGPVDTEFISAEIKRKLAVQTPFGRIATPEEIAHTVIYLLENDYVSGEVVDVNAGRYMD